ncbi:transcriptional regulator, TetR family [Halopseudomonas xinjiangensis]|uniref:Transcriptional regulator, TetR family n=1 Tax=Halopseudomonas xinjiangensis TaxID=487184 RepID=A0A1H1TIV2_9GAMM|nr:TetR family transcriptional regulator [Halopseudomonas xinjiangensis]SDS60140.1 transcriptional regulator, TetR family [Halopseudomonas xinjiangensis]
MVRRTKEEALATRSQIIDAAEKCFHNKGLSRTSLADIASAAGVTRGAIYWHFQDKSELLEALLERATMPLQPLEEASLNRNEVDPLARMRDLIIEIFRGVATDSDIRRINEILLHKCEYTDEMCDLRKRMVLFRRSCDDNIAAGLTNAISRQQLPADLDVPLAARCVHSFIVGTIDQWLMCPGHVDLAAQAGSLADAVLDMVRLSTALRRSQ